MGTPVRQVTPMPPTLVTGTVAGTYAQVARETGFHAPALSALSPAPDLLAATWAVLRESLLLGEADRAEKEIVATGVSLANRCPLCVDAHTTVLRATGAGRLAETIARGATPADPEHAALLGWALATRTPGAAALDRPPFGAGPAAEYVGTTLVVHLINRMVSALLPDDVPPGGPRKRPRTRDNPAGLVFGGVARRGVRPGDSLPLLRGVPPGPEPPWAAGTPTGTAFAALRTVATAGRALLSHEAEAVLRDTVNGWDGSHPPLSGDWLAAPLSSLPSPDRPGAKLALLAALAPYRITDADVAAWRPGDPAGADLVRLVGFGAVTAVNRVEEWITTRCRRHLTVQ